MKKIFFYFVFILFYCPSILFASIGSASIGGNCGQEMALKNFDGGVLNIDCSAASTVGRFFVQTNTYVQENICSPLYVVKTPFFGTFGSTGTYIVNIVFEDENYPFVAYEGSVSDPCGSEVSPVDDSFSVLLGGIFAMCFSLAFSSRLL